MDSNADPVGIIRVLSSDPFCVEAVQNELHVTYFLPLLQVYKSASEKSTLYYGTGIPHGMHEICMNFRHVIELL